MDKMRIRRDEELYHPEEVRHLEMGAEDIVAPAADKIGLQPW